MDQIKPFIQWCQKNIFWIGCFFLAATMIGTWIFSSMQLTQVRRDRVRDIDKKLKALKSVSGTVADGAVDVKAHPNDSTQKGMDEEMDRTINSIVRAWEKRYKEQKEILTWPEEVLGPETANFFSRIEVPEKVTELGRGFEKYRKAFYDNIPDFMHGICRDVGVNWQYDPELIAKKKKEREEQMGSGYGGGMSGPGGPGGGFGPGMGNEDTTMLDEINRYPVNWDQQNQMLWYQKLTTFQGYDDHGDASLYPTYMQANMLMQDLWLLEAMFKNIKEINKGSTSNDTSTIQLIDHIVFGREAINKLGKLTAVDARLGGPDPAMMGPGMGGPGGMPGGMPAGPGDASAAYAAAYGQGGMPGGGPPPGGAYGGGGPGYGAANMPTAAYHNRYVNPDLESIGADDVKAVLGGAELPQTNLELIVAKRVPFRIAVQMDERKINDFIAICANSEFVFEINQLRINRHIDFPGAIVFNGGGATGGGAGAEGKEGMGASTPGLGSGGKAGGPGGDLEPTPVESRSDFLVDVEFYGVVKIYNPVRENFLRLAAGQDVVDETADPNFAPAKPDPAAAAAAAPAANAQAPAQPDAAQPAPDAGNAAQPNAGQPAAAQPDAGGAAADPANAGGDNTQ